MSHRAQRQSPRTATAAAVPDAAAPNRADLAKASRAHAANAGRAGTLKRNHQAVQEQAPRAEPSGKSRRLTAASGGGHGGGASAATTANASSSSSAASVAASSSSSAASSSASPPGADADKVFGALVRKCWAEMDKAEQPLHAGMYARLARVLSAALVADTVRHVCEPRPSRSLPLRPIHSCVSPVAPRRRTDECRSRRSYAGL